MKSYIKKAQKNDDIYYAGGDSVKFNHEGNEGWRLNKKVDRFSNDLSMEAQFEYSNGQYGSKYIGINKTRWRMHE